MAVCTLHSSDQKHNKTEMFSDETLLNNHHLHVQRQNKLTQSCLPLQFIKICDHGIKRVISFPSHVDPQGSADLHLFSPSQTPAYAVRPQMWASTLHGVPHSLTVPLHWPG